MSDPVIATETRRLPNPGEIIEIKCPVDDRFQPALVVWIERYTGICAIHAFEFFYGITHRIDARDGTAWRHIEKVENGTITVRVA